MQESFVFPLIIIVVSGGAKKFMDLGQKKYRKFTCDIININSHKSK